MASHYLAATHRGRRSSRSSLIVLLNFVLFRAMPGSPERILGRNPNVTPEMLAATRERWGLDKPLFPDQFVRYVASTVQGDLGFSYIVARPDRRRGPRPRSSGRRSSCSASARSSRSSSAWPSVPTPAGNAAARSTTSATACRSSSTRRRTSCSAWACCCIFATALGWFPTFGMLDARRGVRRRRSTSSWTSWRTWRCRSRR